MKKIIICLLLLMIAIPSFADILLSPEEDAKARRYMEEGRKKCPKNKPLFDGSECWSCDEPWNIHGGKYDKCSEICPNRISEYECGTTCKLKESPGTDYHYVRCRGWERNEEQQASTAAVNVESRPEVQQVEQEVCDASKPIYSKFIDKTTGKLVGRCYPCEWEEFIDFDHYKDAKACKEKCPNRSLMFLKNSKQWRCMVRE